LCYNLDHASQGLCYNLDCICLLADNAYNSKAMSIGLVATLAGVLLFGAVVGFDDRLLDLAPHLALVWLPSAPLIYGAELLVDVGSPEPWAPAAMLVYILLAASWALAALRWATTAFNRYSRGLSPPCQDRQRRIGG